MGHDAVIEAIELAALERGGLDRLMAGDTATSQAVAAHLVGCDSCTATLAAVERESRIVADIVATTPSADLRARTLAAVRGQTSAAAATAATSAAAATGPAQTAARTTPAPTPVTASSGIPPGASAGPTTTARRRAGLGWVAAIAAAVLLSVGATALVVGDRSQAELATQADTIASLEHVTVGAMTVAAEPDATSVALAGTTDASLAGSVLFSPSSTQLVVVATGMTEPAADQEFRCWMDAGAGRVDIGKMFFGGDLAYWVGDSAAIDGLSGSATFGVSLTEVGSFVLDAEPVLLGRS